MKLHHLICSLALAACGIDSQDRPPPSATTGTDNTGTDNTGTDGAAVPAACRAAATPIHPYTQAAELEAMLIGKWRHCSGPVLVQPSASGEVGIELVADHTYFKLATDAKGRLVRVVGFGGQGTWDTYQETATSVQFDLHPTPSSGTGGYPRFEDDPRRMAALMVEQSVDSIYALEPQ
jgi:hypothetical protein